MRDYDTIKEYIRKLKGNASNITQSNLHDTYELILDSFEDYERAYTDEDKQTALELVDTYINQYEEIKEIYNRLDEAATSNPIDYNNLLDFDEEAPNANNRSIMEEVLERVHMDSGLRQHDNEVHNILLETIGWYFNEIDTVNMLRSFFLKNAEGVVLDEFAYQYGISRNVDEDDITFRNRITAHMKELYRVRDVLESGVKLFTKVDNPYTQLTSTNTYLSHEYLAHADSIVQDYFMKRYIWWHDITWF